MTMPERWQFTKTQIIGIEQQEYDTGQDGETEIWTGAVKTPAAPSSAKEFKTCSDKMSGDEDHLPAFGYWLDVPLDKLYGKGLYQGKDRMVCQDGADVYVAQYLGVTPKAS